MESMEKVFISAEEVAKIMDISKSYAYRVIRKLNDELESRGFITIQGRIDRKFFFDQFYGTSEKERKEVV